MNKTEKQTISKMIHIYCEGKHGTSHYLCESCAVLNRYAQHRLDVCKFGEEKPICKKCPTHCYKSEMKKQVQDVMRYSGPRLFFRSPLLALIHLFKSFK